MADEGGSPRIRNAFVDTAAVAVQLLHDPAVATAWDGPSALEAMPVSALAGHLARQIFAVRRGLVEPAASEEPVPVLEHYTRAAWLGAELDADPNVRIRHSAEAEAGVGPGALAGRAGEALAELRPMLTSATDRLVRAAPAPWALTLDDFLLTRTLELVVHCDDLAASVSVPTPPMPAAALEPVLALLFKIAVHRRGSLALLRALSRAERSAGPISAL